MDKKVASRIHGDSNVYRQIGDNNRWGFEEYPCNST